MGPLGSGLVALMGGAGVWAASWGSWGCSVGCVVFLRFWGAPRLVRARGGGVRSPRRWVARFSTSFFSAVESHVREPNAAAAHLWDDLRSLKGVSVHFNSPGAAAALRFNRERE